MTNQATKRPAGAKTTKSAVAKGGKHSPAANVEGNEMSARVPRAGAGGKKRKEPFVL